MLVSQISPNKYNNSYASQNLYSQQRKSPTFTSVAQAVEKTVEVVGKKDSKVFNPLSKAYNCLTDGIAHCLVGVLDNKYVAKVIDRAGKSEHWQKNSLSHLIVFGSTLLSGFYVKKTLDNDKLEKDKKITLAINQTATWAISTILAYTLDKKMNNAVKKFREKMLAVNNLDKSTKAGERLYKGIGAAKTMIIIGLVYRFLAPVLVTPISNAIGNKLASKKAVNENSKV